MIVTGKYEKDGKTRNRYHKVGIMFATPHFSNISIKLDSVPIGGDGWIKPFVREDWQGEQINDEPVNPGDIPF